MFNFNNRPVGEFMHLAYFFRRIAKLIVMATSAMFVFILVPPSIIIFSFMVLGRGYSDNKSGLNDSSSGTIAAKDDYSETQWLTERRQKLRLPQHDQLTGLALSGGGIRAAFIARGFIDELAREKKFQNIDYLSGVSGGAYTVGSILNAFETGSQLPLGAEYEKVSPEVDYKGILSVPFDFILNVFPVFIFISLFQYILFLSKSYLNAFVLFAGLTIVCKILTIIPRDRLLNERERARGTTSNAQYFLAIFAGLSIGSLTSLILSEYVKTSLDIAVVCVLIAITLVGFHYFKISSPHKSEKDNPILPYAWAMIFASVSFLAQPVITDTIIKFLGIRGVIAEQGTAKISMHTALIVGMAWIVLLILAYIFVIRQTNVHRVNASNWLYKAYRDNLIKRFTPRVTKKKFYDYRLANQGVPYPIINATRTDGLKKERFEITPIDSGTDDGDRSATSEWLPRLALGDAVAISGSALDALGLNIGLKSVVGFIAAGTGYWLPISKNLLKKSLGVSFSHLAITMGLRAKIVLRLTDGGFTENLGVASLIRRHVDVVYCLDSEYDPNFEFESLRKLISMSRAKYNARIELPNIAGLPDLYRMRQNTCSIICGAIHYFDSTGEKVVKTGKYFHIKINNAVFDHKSDFLNFPYFPTTDQRLRSEQIEALCELGESLAKECIAHQFI
jgi:hypothetical protein